MAWCNRRDKEMPTLFGMLIAFLTLLYGSVAAGSLDVEDFRGRKISFERPVQRVVCLIESGLSGLFMLGVQDRVVAISTNVYQEKVYRYYAAMDERIAARQLPSPGNWDFVNIESVITQRPDLVIIWASQTEAIEALEEKGIPVYGVELDSFADVYKEIKDFGIIFGENRRASHLVGFVERELAGLAAVSSGLAAGERPNTYFMWPQGLLETSGKSSTVNDLIELAGGHNVCSYLQQEHLVVNLENIVTWQPDVIILWPNPKMKSADLAALPVWRSLPAARTGRIHQLPSVFFCDLWTLKFLHTVKLLSSWFHPEKWTHETTEMGKRALMKELYGARLGERIPLGD